VRDSGTSPRQQEDVVPNWLTQIRRAVRLKPAVPPAPAELFPLDYSPPGQAGKSYSRRVRTGFFNRYCSGPVVLDVGFTGYANPERRAALPHAIGVDLDYPGYDGVRLPFADGSVDTIFSSHCLEHIPDERGALRDWMRVLKVGGFLVCMAPHQALYEKRWSLPSRWNEDHKRFYTPASLLTSIEQAFEANSYRIRHMKENDAGFDYSLGSDVHSSGCYEIELVVEKIMRPTWTLA
jgi:SAM-dependent methyltransferase